MKKTVAALALSVSTPSFALMMPPTKVKTICLDAYENENGAQYAGNCDQSKNNVTTGATLLGNGCAEGQIALSTVAYPVTVWKPAQKKNVTVNKFDIEIKSCLPPNVAQL